MTANFYLEEKGLPSVNEHLSIEKQRDELMAALERMLRSYRVLKPVGYPLSDAEKRVEGTLGITLEQWKEAFKILCPKKEQK